MTVTCASAPKRSPRKRIARACGSVGVAKAQLAKTLVADAEVMRDLVHDRVANDLRLSPRRRGHPLDRTAEDADAIRQIGLHRAAVGQRNALIETKELAAVA